MSPSFYKGIRFPNGALYSLSYFYMFGFCLDRMNDLNKVLITLKVLNLASKNAKLNARKIIMKKSEERKR